VNKVLPGIFDQGDVAAVLFDMESVATPKKPVASSFTW